MQSQATVYYTKRIDSGTLRGLLVPASLSYPTVAQAAKAVHIGKVVRPSRNGPGYTIVDASFQRYER